MKSIFTIILLCCLSTAFAQTPKRQVADDIYGKPQKSLVEVDQPKVNLQLPGKYLKKAGNSLTGAILLGILTGVVASVTAKENPDISKYVYIGGGVITTGLFVSAAYNLSRAGDELTKVLEETRP